jgi:hypothetical protein
VSKFLRGKQSSSREEISKWEQSSSREKISLKEKDKCESKYMHPKQMCNNENYISYWNTSNNYMFVTINPPSYLSKYFH